MPIYNKAARLEASIQSVLQQTKKDFELVLINDGSTDGSDEIALRYASKHPQIQYYSQKNQGVAAARNYGLRLAKGEYISFLDADDEWDESFLEKMLDGISDSNVCYCGSYNVRETDKQKARIIFAEGDLLSDYLNNKTTPNANSWLIKRELIEKHDIRFPIGMDWGEDMTFFSKVLLYETDVRDVQEYLTEYHRDIVNNLSENNLDKIEKDINWMIALQSYIEQHEEDSERRKKAVRAIESYRLPGTIIYRLYANLGTEDKNTIKNKLKKHKNHLKKMRCFNGIRSFKLYMYYIRLKMKLI